MHSHRLLAAAAATVVVFSAAAAAAQVAPGRQRELLELLHQDCGSCHGLTLKGGLGPPLTPAALAGKPEASLVRSILEGRPGTPMPPWRDFLTESEARWLVDTLRRGATGDAH